MTTACRKLALGDYIFIALCFTCGVGCIYIFGYLLFPASEGVDIVGTSWVATGTGLLIFLWQAVRLKTKQPTPIGPNGVGAAFVGLGTLIMSSGILIEIYQNFQLPILNPIGGVLIFVGVLLLVFGQR